jgi:hypothetical protein
MTHTHNTLNPLKVGATSATSHDHEGASGSTVGKRTLVEQTWGSPSLVATTASGSLPRVQLKDVPAAAAREPDRVKAAAELGTSGAAGALPHRDRIQAAFGRHDVSNVQAFVGGPAATGAAQMGAQAFASGDKVAFGAAPDLHTAAHEAAHVVQQRGGVQLKGGVGEVGDPYERHADAVADQVVRGGSAEALLDPMAGGGARTASPGVQRPEVQRMIIPIGDLAGDGASPQQQSDAHIIDQSTRRLRQATRDDVERLDDSGVRRPLAALRNAEELNIVAHGGSPIESAVAETYGGNSPAALARLLLANGLRRTYHGTIYLNGCNTATRSPRRQSYAERFQAELLRLGVNASVRGNEGSSRVLANGETGFPREDEEGRRRFEEISLEHARLADQMQSLRTLQGFARAPQTLVGDESALHELGLDANAGVEAILPALQKMAQTRLEQSRLSSERVAGGLDSDALFERRPDSIVTLPRQATDNEILGMVFVVMVAAFAIAARCAPPLSYFVLLLGVVISLALAARAMRGRQR